MPYVKTLNRAGLGKYLPYFRGIVAGYEFKHMTTCFVQRIAQESRLGKVLTGEALIDGGDEYDVHIPHDN